MIAQEKAKNEPAQFPGKRGMMGKMNLTEEQQKKMQNLRIELEKKQIANRAKLQTAKVEMRQILNGDKLDKAALEKKLTEISKLEIEQKMTFINHWEQVNQMLTPEQQAIWKNRLKMFDAPGKQKMMKRFMHDRRGDRPGMRSPGRMRGDIPEINERPSELAMLLTPEFEFPDIDEEFDLPEPPEFEEFFECEIEMGESIPEPELLN